MSNWINVGEPAPWFRARSTSNPNYHFESVAGRYVVLCFLESTSKASSQRILSDICHRYREIFDDTTCCFFGVSVDPDDQARSQAQQQLPGIRFFWDFDQEISRKFGVIDANGTYYPCTYILDERLRILSVVPFTDNIDTHVESWINYLMNLPSFPSDRAKVQAPILVVPRIFEPELCRFLIDYYLQNGGEESGFMREKNGQTIHVSDHAFKRRRDQDILDDDLRDTAMHRIHDRLVPEIYKAFQFQASRIERHIVACYSSETSGFFKPHRDNTTKGTAHRRFAVSLNLNTGEYEGGMLRFPEFGQQTYEAPAGGAVVFSCSLLHEATPVTKGTRYAYLPFLYDDHAAKIRQKNRQFIVDSKFQDQISQDSSVPRSTRDKGFQAKQSRSRRKRR